MSPAANCEDHPSPSANIVEGYGRRRYKAELIRFLVYAHASCDESIEWLAYLMDIYSDLTDDINPVLDLANNTGGKLNRFIESVELHHNEF